MFKQYSALCQHNTGKWSCGVNWGQMAAYRTHYFLFECLQICGKLTTCHTDSVEDRGRDVEEGGERAAETHNTRRTGDFCCSQAFLSQNEKITWLWHAHPWTAHTQCRHNITVTGCLTHTQTPPEHSDLQEPQLWHCGFKLRLISEVKSTSQQSKRKSFSLFHTSWGGDKVHLFRTLVNSFLSSSFYPYSVCFSLCLFYVLLFLSVSSLSSPFILLPLNFLSSSSLHHLFPSCDLFASFPPLFSYFHHISSSPLFSSCLSTCSRPPSLPTDSPPSLSRLITSLLLASDKQLQFSPAGYITRVMSAALDCHPLDWQSQLPLPASLLLFLCACVSVQHLSVYFNARHRRRSQPLSINLT